MKLILFIFIGMLFTYTFILLAGNFGLMLVGGATFGVLLYIATEVRKRD
ncbi:hypothetical protein P4V41_02650 [Fictibacillus nanhaiensis]|nr:hypothetical protein [Fictibacillus nanhaiensis]